MTPFRPSRRAVLLTMLAAACQPTTGSPSTAPAVPSVPTSQPTTRTVKHALGETVVRVPATRVVTLDYSFLDAVLSLGVTPVGAALGTAGGDRGAPTYLKTMAAGVASAGSRAQPELETIAAMRPDLIIADDTAQRDVFPQLAQIGPTIVFNSRTGTIDDIFTQAIEIGRLVGKADEADRLVKEQQARFSEVKARTTATTPIVTGVAVPNSFTLHTSASFVGSLIDRLGRPNANAPRGAQTQYEIDAEGLASLKPQSLVLYTGADEEPITRRWSREPLWATLPAVQRGRVYQFDRDLWTRSRGIRGLRIMIDQAIESGLLTDAAPTGRYAF